MERKEQTGHICRWMALGIVTAIVIVGCTIVIGLFEWRDRKEIECRNAELHQWRKNVHDLNLHITELSLLGEMVADWDSTDVNEYHSLDWKWTVCLKASQVSVRKKILIRSAVFLQKRNSSFGI